MNVWQISFDIFKCKLVNSESLKRLLFSFHRNIEDNLHVKRHLNVYRLKSCHRKNVINQSWAQIVKNGDLTKRDTLV